jgi:hypothetical protein
VERIGEYNSSHPRKFAPVERLQLIEIEISPIPQHEAKQKSCPEPVMRNP